MTRTTPRSGFTLVELLVAIALAIVVLSLAIYIVNTAAFDSYKVVGSGDRLSQWLMQAKNRALRDRQPRGVRLFVTDQYPDGVTVTGLNVVKECAFIEQPDPWFPTDPSSVFQLVYLWDGTTYPNQSYRPGQPGKAYLTLSANDLAGFQSAGVQSGDVIYVPDLGKSYIITSAPVANPAVQAGVPTGASYELSLASLPDLGAANSNATSQPNTATYQTRFFGIVRQPQVLLGEPTMLIPSGMAVDVLNSLASPSKAVSTGVSATASGTPNYIDILFAPGGEVLPTPAVTDQGYIGLLLRDLNKFPRPISLTGPAGNPTDFDQAGEMVIVAIYPKTGAIATHPVANDPTDPHKFAKDAVNTGL